MFGGRKEVHDPDFNAIEMDQVDAEDSMFESEDEIEEMFGDKVVTPTVAERKARKANIFNQKQ